MEAAFACQTGRTDKTVDGSEAFREGFILKCSVKKCC